MKYFSKYPVFFALLIILLVAFAGMFAYDFYLFRSNSEAAKSEELAARAFVRAVEADPGKEAVLEAQRNIDSLKERLDLLDKDLSRDSSKILASSSLKEGYQLTARIKSLVDQWKTEATLKQISFPADYSFSFKKYLDAGAKAPADSAVEDLWRQASVLDNIMKKLFASKRENSPLSIISVQREILPAELEEEKAQAAAAGRGRAAARGTNAIRSNTGDTFDVEKAISARKEGNINTIGYRLVFASYSDTLRRFLNELNSYDLMLVVRSIEVKPTVDNSAAPKAKEEEASMADMFAAALEESEGVSVEKSVASKDPVVSENLSEFTIVIEFVEVAKDAPSAEKTGAAANNEEGE